MVKSLMDVRDLGKGSESAGAVRGPVLERLISMLQSVPARVLDSASMEFDGAGSSITVSLHDHMDWDVWTVVNVLALDWRDYLVDANTPGRVVVKFGPQYIAQPGIRVIWYVDVVQAARALGPENWSTSAIEMAQRAGYFPYRPDPHLVEGPDPSAEMANPTSTRR